MRDSGGRRSVFKYGKGLAFLRFLVGEMVLVVLVSVVYLFILQGEVKLPSFSPETEATDTLPTEEVTPQPVQEGEADAANIDASATLEPTQAPTQAPTPVPTSTPVPYEQLNTPLGAGAPALPDSVSAAMKQGLRNLSAFLDAGQKIICVDGYAYITGKDAADSMIYLVVSEAVENRQADVYAVSIVPETANLTFNASSGSNLDQAFFTANINVASYPDGYYLLSAMVVNGDETFTNYFDARTYHFRIEGGVPSIVE